MSNQFTIRYQGGLRCEATRQQGGPIVLTDVGTDHGGRGECFSPPELASVALGTCVMSVMAIVGERSKVDLSGMEVEVSTEMAAGAPRRIGAANLTIRLPNAKDLSDAVRQKLEATAYACPVKNSLHPDIAITLQFVYG